MNDNYYLERLTVSELKRLKKEVEAPDSSQKEDLKDGFFTFIKHNGEIISFKELERLPKRIEESIDRALENEKLKDGRLKFVYPTGSKLETVQELIKIYQLDEKKIEQYLNDCIRNQKETSYYLISESLPLLRKLGVENGRLDMKYIRLVENIKLTLRNAMLQFTE